jgi:hypothetical protein
MAMFWNASGTKFYAIIGSWDRFGIATYVYP